MKRDDVRQELMQLLERNIKELQHLRDELADKPDSLDLWTYLEDLEHVIPTNLETDAGKLYNMLECSCLGCGCEPGDGVTEGCEHPEGCGWARDVHDATDEEHR